MARRRKYVTTRAAVQEAVAQKLAGAEMAKAPADRGPAWARKIYHILEAANRPMSVTAICEMSPAETMAGRIPRETAYATLRHGSARGTFITDGTYWAIAPRGQAVLPLREPKPVAAPERPRRDVLTWVLGGLAAASSILIFALSCPGG